MNRRLGLLCMALACIALSACRSSEAAPAPGPPAVVVAPPLVVRLSEWDEYPGRFEATDRVDVRARVDGYLDSIHFRDGALVRPGDLLFVIDPRPYDAALDARPRRRGPRARPASSWPPPTSFAARRCSRFAASARRSSTAARRRARKPKRR